VGIKGIKRKISCILGLCDFQFKKTGRKIEVIRENNISSIFLQEYIFECKFCGKEDWRYKKMSDATKNPGKRNAPGSTFMGHGRQK